MNKLTNTRLAKSCHFLEEVIRNCDRQVHDVTGESIAMIMYHVTESEYRVNTT